MHTLMAADTSAVTMVYVAGRLTIAGLLETIGAIAVLYGYWLYKSGVGIQKDALVVSVDSPNWKLGGLSKTVCSSLLLTSVVWGFLSYLSLPNSFSGGDGVVVAQADIEEAISEKVNLSLRGVRKLESTCFMLRKGKIG